MCAMEFYSESEHVQEVFTHFGEDELFDANLEQTVGALKKEIQSRITLPVDINVKLERTTESRN